MVVDTTLDKEAYQELQGIKKSVLNVRNMFNVTDVPAEADNGAAVSCAPSSSVSCAPSSTVSQMGLKMSITFRSRVCLYVAVKRKLNINGCIPVVVTGRKPNGRRSSARELLYCVENIKDVHLSQEVLMDIGSLNYLFLQIQTENSPTKYQRISTSDTNQTPSYAEFSKLDLKRTIFNKEEINPSFQTPLQSPALSRAFSRSSVLTINRITAVIPYRKSRKAVKPVKGHTSSEPSLNCHHPLAPATPAPIITKVSMDTPLGEIIDSNAGMNDNVRSSDGAAVTRNYYYLLTTGVWSIQTPFHPNSRESKVRKLFNLAEVKQLKV